MNQTVLVTGSSGMIGTALCEEFSRRGTSYLALDVRKNPWNRELSRKTLSLDLRQTAATLKKIPGKIDAVVHLAAHSRVMSSIQNPLLGSENCAMTLTALQIARAKKCPIIFASSREVYGTIGAARRMREDAVQLLSCESPYAASKIAGEAFIYAFAKSYGVPYVVTRFSNAFGRYDVSDRVIPSFLKRLFHGQDLNVYGKNKVLDFIYIDDAVASLAHCALNARKLPCSTVNIASGQGVSIRELARLLQKKIPSHSRVKMMPERRGEVARFVADTRLAQKKLNHKIHFSIDAALDQTILWYRNFWKLKAE